MAPLIHISMNRIVITDEETRIYERSRFELYPGPLRPCHQPLVEDLKLFNYPTIQPKFSHFAVGYSTVSVAGTGGHMAGLSGLFTFNFLSSQQDCQCSISSRTPYAVCLFDSYIAISFFYRTTYSGDEMSSTRSFWPVMASDHFK
jgi:hypothetical protein